MTSFVLAAACARTPDLERAEPGVDGGRNDAGGGTGDTGGSSDSGGSSDGGFLDVGVSDNGGPIVIDAGGGPADFEALRNSADKYCGALRECDPDNFESRFGSPDGCRESISGQVEVYYDQGQLSVDCVRAFTGALSCAVDFGYCTEYYDEYGQRQVGLQPSQECADAFEDLEQSCGSYGGYGGYGEDDGYDGN